MSVSQDEIQQTFDQDTAGSDESIVAGASGAATGGGLAQGGGFLNTNIAGNQFGGIGNTVTYTDAGAYDLARDFMSGYSETLADLVAKQSEAAAEAGSKTNTLVEGLLAKFGELVESKNTDGESSRNNTMLYIALAIAAVFGIFFWRRAKA